MANSNSHGQRVYITNPDSVGTVGGAGGLTDTELRASAVSTKIDQTTNGTTNAVFVKNGASFSIPAFNYMAFTYVGSTNNISTQTFKSGGGGGITVATLTYTYIAAGLADDDDIATITQS